MIAKRDGFPRRTKVLVFACIFSMIIVAQGSFLPCHAQTTESQNQTEPKKEKPSSNNILPSPEHKISPVQPEAIEKAAKKLEATLSSGSFVAWGAGYVQMPSRASRGYLWLSAL